MSPLVTRARMKAKRIENGSENISEDRESIRVTYAPKSRRISPSCARRVISDRVARLFPYITRETPKRRFLRDWCFYPTFCRLGRRGTGAPRRLRHGGRRGGDGPEGDGTRPWLSRGSTGVAAGRRLLRSEKLLRGTVLQYSLYVATYVMLFARPLVRARICDGLFIEFSDSRVYSHYISS